MRNPNPTLLQEIQEAKNYFHVNSYREEMCLYIEMSRETLNMLHIELNNYFTYILGMEVKIDDRMKRGSFRIDAHRL